jgi:hypothetical protein
MHYKLTIPAFSRFSAIATLIVSVLWSIAIVVSCNLLEPRPVIIRSGNYEGQYSLIRDSAGQRIIEAGDIRMNFADGAFTIIPIRGSSIPLAGSGTYSLRYREITFTDTEERPVGTPRTHILQGAHTYTFDGMTVVISRTDAATNSLREIVVTRL